MEMVGKIYVQIYNQNLKEEKDREKKIRINKEKKRKTSLGMKGGKGN